jgi:chaperonin GroES
MKKMKYRPLGDRILVQPLTVEEKNKSGIIITDSIERGEFVYGTVISTGKGIYTQSGTKIPISVKEGDTVMYRQDMVGDKLTLDDIEYILFRDSDLLMVGI